MLEQKQLAEVGLFPAGFLVDVGTRLLAAYGAPEEEAAIVAGDLVEASLMGIDSHGVMRFPQYVDDVRRGKTRPGAPVRVVRETPNTAVVDCGFNFGAVGAARMVEIVCAKALTHDVSFSVSRNSAHIGRLGAYVQRIAERGMVGFATCNSSKHGHWVVPWGGRDGRLATNPLAFAVPTSGRPVVLDMSTSSISEGKIRLLMHQGKPIPPGCVQDAFGNPVTDPRDFYGPPKGAIRPFGGEMGFKGYGLAVLVEIMSGILAGEPSSEDRPYVNGLSIFAINPANLCGKQCLIDLMDDLCAYHTSSSHAPGCSGVVLPGAYDFEERDRRLVRGIPVAAEVWNQIQECGRAVGVDIPGILAEAGTADGR